MELIGTCESVATSKTDGGYIRPPEGTPVILLDQAGRSKCRATNSWIKQGEWRVGVGIWTQYNETKFDWKWQVSTSIASPTTKIVQMELSFLQHSITLRTWTLYFSPHQHIYACELDCLCILPLKLFVALFRSLYPFWKACLWSAAPRARHHAK